MNVEKEFARIVKIRTTKKSQFTDYPTYTQVCFLVRQVRTELHGIVPFVGSGLPKGSRVFMGLLAMCLLAQGLWWRGMGNTML